MKMLLSGTARVAHSHEPEITEIGILLRHREMQVKGER
jgi:hypothetical protein